MSDMEQWINEPEEDFHPAKAGDNPIWLGGMKYVRADRIEELEAKLAKAVEALKRIAGPKAGPDFDWTEQEVIRWRATWFSKYESIARTTLAKLRSNTTGGKDE